MNLQVKLCAGWGPSATDLEQAPPAVEMLALPATCSTREWAAISLLKNGMAGGQPLNRDCSADLESLRDVVTSQQREELN
jgi:hypothetical protein